MNFKSLSGISLTILGTTYYIYRLYKIPNCLFRIDSSNEKKLYLSALYSGFIGPINSLYLDFRYNGLSNTLVVFKELFITYDNPILISIIFGSFWYFINFLFKKYENLIQDK